MDIATLSQITQVNGHPPHTFGVRRWSLNANLLGVLGIFLILTRSLNSELGHVGETIVVVIYLGVLAGMAPTITIPRWVPFVMLPFACGWMSTGMDSFIILLLVAKTAMHGLQKYQIRFKSVITVAALIGGLGLYLGEVFAIPLAKMYGQEHVLSMAPLWPAITIFLSILCIYAWRLKDKVKLDPAQESQKTTWRDIIQFLVGIILLLVTHNAWLCLGFLLICSSVLGEGEDVIEVLKSKTEVGVMILLVIALLASFLPEIEHFLSGLSNGKLFFAAVAFNGVLVGAIFPAKGNFLQEIILISTAVPITPFSSLVGVMVFKFSEWKEYMKVSIPAAALWFCIATGCLYVQEKIGFNDWIYDTFSVPRPVLQHSEPHPQSDDAVVH